MKLPGSMPPPMPQQQATAPMGQRPPQMAQMAPQAPQQQPMGLSEIISQMEAEGLGPDGGDGWHQELTTRAIDEMGMERVLQLTGDELAQVGIHLDPSDASAYDALDANGRMEFLNSVRGGNFMAEPGGM